MKRGIMIKATLVATLGMLILGSYKPEQLRAKAQDFSAYITGPTDVNSASQCVVRYDAVASGGSGSYSYDWDTSGTITNQSDNYVYIHFPNPPEGNYVHVVVTDDVNATQTEGFLELTAGPSGMWCFN